jgi:predicted DNA-binding protein (MmcQ/YjbR family)
VVIETFRSTTGDFYNCLAFKASFLDHEKLSGEPQYFPAPYLGGAGWLGCRLDDAEEGPDLDQLFSVLSRSHRQIAGGATAASRRNRERHTQT